MFSASTTTNSPTISSPSTWTRHSYAGWSASISRVTSRSRASSSCGVPASDDGASTGVNAAIVPVVQGYWTSFIRAKDPNTFRREGTPEWEAWTSGNEYTQLRFRTNATAMKAVPHAQRERCDYLSSIGEALRQ